METEILLRGEYLSYKPYIYHLPKFKNVDAMEVGCTKKEDIREYEAYINNLCKIMKRCVDVQDQISNVSKTEKAKVQNIYKQLLLQQKKITQRKKDIKKQLLEMKEMLKATKVLMDRVHHKTTSQM